jgi:uncharacterized protein YqeY
MNAKKKLMKQIDQIKHPGSRKTAAAIKQVKKIKSRKEVKNKHALKVIF